MSAKFVLACGNHVTLHPGVYKTPALAKYHILNQVLVEVCACPGVRVQITGSNDFNFELINDRKKVRCKDTFAKVTSSFIITVEQLYPPFNDEWDYIIIGGVGTAGAILANLLSNNHNHQVLVLDNGIFHQDDPIVQDPNWIAHAPDLFFNPLYARSFTFSVGGLNGAILTTGNGSTAAHNFMLAVRGTPPTYEAWASASNDTKWLYNNLLPYMRNIETYTPNGTIADPAQRGSNGPIKITQEPPFPSNAVMNAWVSVANAPAISDYNNPTLGNVGTVASQNFWTPPPNSIRSYSESEYLKFGTVIDRNGNGLGGRKLKVVTSATVLRFHMNRDNRATSVAYLLHQGTSTEKLCCAKLAPDGRLLVCAGTFCSPKLLQLSGIGAQADLEELGIEVKIDSPQVGKNFTTHYASQVQTTGTLPPDGTLMLVNLSPYFPNDEQRRMEVIPIQAGPTILYVPFITHPSSVGDVRIVGTNPLWQPLVNFMPYSDGDGPDSDVTKMVALYKIIAEVAQTAGGTILNPPLSSFPPPFGPAPNDNMLRAAARAAVTYQAHPSCTCRMGTDISNGVVDGNLKVFGSPNIWVCDASVQPLIMDGNTTAAVYYLARRLATILGAPVPV